MCLIMHVHVHVHVPECLITHVGRPGLVAVTALPGPPVSVAGAPARRLPGSQYRVWLWSGGAAAVPPGHHTVTCRLGHATHPAQVGAAYYDADSAQYPIGMLHVPRGTAKPLSDNAMVLPIQHRGVPYRAGGQYDCSILDPKGNGTKGQNLGSVVTLKELSNVEATPADLTDDKARQLAALRFRVGGRACGCPGSASTIHDLVSRA
jgi:hypothetical protein